MKPVIGVIARAGRALHPLATIALVLALNVQWTFTIQAFGREFERAADVPVLDLQNVQGVLSPTAAQELISAYSPADVSLYWTFFAMDNVVPLLCFGSFAVLWAFFLSRSRWAISGRLAKSWFLLIPFGVGAFDIVENTFFVSAMASSDSSEQLVLLTWGLAFVQAKAAMIFATFATTLLLTAVYIVERILNRTGHGRQK